jgi:RNA methyltransferase, TrmH family
VPRATSRLTSRQHAIVRRFRELARRRDDHRDVLLDGAHVIAEALKAGVAIDTVLASTEFLQTASADDRAIVDRAARSGAAVYEATASVLDAASPVRTASGVVASATWMPSPIAAVLDAPRALVLGLIGVQDPGNVGGAIRSAHGLGATGVIAMEGTAHPGGWKALRGSMGSTFHLPIAQGSTDAVIAAARGARLRIVATIAGSGTLLGDVNLKDPVLLLVGNEGAGLPGPVLAAADIRATVPMSPTVNSLNVSVTAALLLYEAFRQRIG